MKAKIKKILMSNDRLWSFYSRKKLFFRHIYMLRFYLFDISNTYKFMFWASAKKQKIEVVKAEILFQFHKLEKGLIMPGKRRVFGEAVALRLIELLTHWQSQGYRVDDSIYLGALATLKVYRKKVIEDGYELQLTIMPRLTHFLEKSSSQIKNGYETPIVLSNNYRSGFNGFNDLVEFRRSVRDYEQVFVEPELIKKAVGLAQMSPSVCNRQASKVYFIQDKNKMNFLLSNQNGNAGFGERIPSLAIITVDQNCFFNATERHQPYIDGGLFTMTFLYALSAQGLSSCCLNWCVLPKVDKKVHYEMKIPFSERIMMLIAIGFPAKGVKVPLSCRKDVSDVFIQL